MAMVPERPLDAEAIGTCHREYGPMLERYAWAMVRDWSLAADAVQLAFIALARFGGDVAPEARKNWLFRVVYREAVRLRQKQAGRSGSADSEQILRESHASYELEPVDKILQEETNAELTRWIQELPEEQRRVLELRIYHDKTFAEIADELSIPLGTALSRMRLAVERLRAKSIKNQ